MSNNETRISNERLAEMLAGLEGVTPGPWNRRRVGHQWAVEDRHTRHIAMMQNSVDERQGNAAHIARCDPETIHAMILELQALRSTPVEAEPVAWRHRGPKGGWITTEIKQPWSEQPLYAHPLHNPSPSDGEVSDVLRRARNYIDDMPHLFPENAHPNDRDTHRQLEAEREPLLLALTAAIQSKRGQP